LVSQPKRGFSFGGGFCDAMFGSFQEPQDPIRKSRRRTADLRIH
jgi:hypothetical protein